MDETATRNDGLEHRLCVMNLVTPDATMKDTKLCDISLFCDKPLSTDHVVK